MAEEIKDKKDEQSNKSTAMIIKFVLGLVFLLLGSLAIKTWWYDFIGLVKGFFGLFLLLIGVILLAIAKE